MPEDEAISNRSAVVDPVFGKFVKFAPDIAGKTLGNLASGIVPEVKLLASKFVRSTGKLVRFAPLIAGKVAGNLASGIVPVSYTHLTLPTSG